MSAIPTVTAKAACFINPLLLVCVQLITLEGKEEVILYSHVLTNCSSLKALTASRCFGESFSALLSIGIKPALLICQIERAGEVSFPIPFPQSAVEGAPRSFCPTPGDLFRAPGGAVLTRLPIVLPLGFLEGFGA